MKITGRRMFHAAVLKEKISEAYDLLVLSSIQSRKQERDIFLQKSMAILQMLIKEIKD